MAVLARRSAVAAHPTAAARANMHIFVQDGGVKRPVTQMTIPQAKQAAAIMDCFGRLIPQEGVDYDVEITFKGSYSPSVSIGVVAHTDKGEWWKKYVLEMIKKYPPMVQNPDPSIPEDASDDSAEASHA